MKIGIIGIGNVGFQVLKDIQSNSKINKFLNIANILFKDNHSPIPKHWKPFDKIFKKENIQRKECLLLPINALIRIIKNYDK